MAPTRKVNPRPIGPLAALLSELQCNVCTWVCTYSDGKGNAQFTLKYVNRLCSYHSRLIGDW